MERSPTSARRRRSSSGMARAPRCSASGRVSRCRITGPRRAWAASTGCIGRSRPAAISRPRYAASAPIVWPIRASAPVRASGDAVVTSEEQRSDDADARRSDLGGGLGEGRQHVRGRPVSLGGEDRLHALERGVRDEECLEQGGLSGEEAVDGGPRDARLHRQLVHRQRRAVRLVRPAPPRPPGCARGCPDRARYRARRGAPPGSGRPDRTWRARPGRLGERVDRCIGVAHRTSPAATRMASRVVGWPATSVTVPRSSDRASHATTLDKTSRLVNARPAQTAPRTIATCASAAISVRTSRTPNITTGARSRRST